MFNAVLPLVILLVSASLDYYTNYPAYYNFVSIFEYFEWATFTGILITTVLLSGVLACFKLKSIPYVFRLLRINILLDIGLLILVSVDGIRTFLDAKTEYDSLSSKYKIKAESDIRNGLIVYETAGFPVPLDSFAEIKEDKIDSLMKTYGLTTQNIGCMILGPLLRAQYDYEVLTDSYLDQRNGIGWRHRMKKQIEDVRKN